LYSIFTFVLFINLNLDNTRKMLRVGHKLVMVGGKSRSEELPTVVDIFDVVTKQ